MKRTAALILAGTLAFACGESNTNDKGAEENPLTDGKSDSFFRPTEHGGLRMGLANPARLTEDEQFHAWTFELSDTAQIDLHTEVSQNLDTVMYLYHRTSPDDSWGRYIKKNDDDGDNIASRIALETDAAGEYRVIVKGYKSALRGSFSLHGECTGAGCVADTGGSCDAEEFESLPTMKPFNADCAFDLAGLMSSAPSASSSGWIPLSEKCALTGLERKSIDFYHEWWDDIAGFDDIIAYGEDDVELSFEVEQMRGGTIITIGAGGDEDAISFYYDEDETLLASYQHNQSPTIDYYCPDAGAPIEGPDESCFTDIRFALPHESESDREFGEAADAHPAIQLAVDRFVDEFGVDAGSVSWEMVTWTSTNDENVAAVNILGPDDGSAEYTAFEDYDGWKVIMRADPNGVSFICD